MNCVNCGNEIKDDIVTKNTNGFKCPYCLTCYFYATNAGFCVGTSYGGTHMLLTPTSQFFDPKNIVCQHTDGEYCQKRGLHTTCSMPVRRGKIVCNGINIDCLEK